MIFFASIISLFAFEGSITVMVVYPGSQCNLNIAANPSSNKFLQEAQKECISMNTGKIMCVNKCVEFARKAANSRIPAVKSCALPAEKLLLGRNNCESSAGLTCGLAYEFDSSCRRECVKDANRRCKSSRA